MFDLNKNREGVPKNIIEESCIGEMKESCG